MECHQHNRVNGYKCNKGNYHDRVHGSTDECHDGVEQHQDNSDDGVERHQDCDSDTSQRSEDGYQHRNECHQIDSIKHMERNQKHDDIDMECHQERYHDTN